MTFVGAAGMSAGLALVARWMLIWSGFFYNSFQSSF